MPGREEVIVVRSLAESDLGLFAAHRETARSKQRAININADVARQLLSPSRFAAGGVELVCTCTFNGYSETEPRPLAKSQKNWRLGGKKLEGMQFGTLDSQDFILLRTVKGNTGKDPVDITFIGKQSDAVVHAGIAAVVARDLRDSMALYTSDERAFHALATYCPSNTARGTQGRADPDGAGQAHDPQNLRQYVHGRLRQAAAERLHPLGAAPESLSESHRRRQGP